MRQIVIALSLLLLAACTESYGASGTGSRVLLGGGYDDKQLDASRWEIRYGSGDIGWSRDMALLRSAEIAKREGFPFFTVTETNIQFVPIYSGNRYVGSSAFVTVQMQGVKAYADRCASGRLIGRNLECDLYETDDTLDSFN